MNRSAAVVVFAFVVFTLWLHWFVALQGAFSHAAGGGLGLWVWQSVLETPLAWLSLSLQLALILGLYGLFFSCVVWLGRRRAPEPESVSSPAIVMGLTAASALWLVMHIHSRLFPFSVWKGAPDPSAGSLAMLLLDAIAAAWLLWRLIKAFRSSPVVAAVALLGLAAVITLQAAPGAARKPQAETTSKLPDVVIIGLDSLRRDLMLEADEKSLPHLAAFRDRAYVQGGLVSSLARTYPSWVSVMTGLPVQKTGARENHAPASGTAFSDSLAWKLQQAGYETIFASDDTQFSHLGEQFGFQRVIAPEPGVANFALSRFADLPLVNLFIQLPGAEFLLPALVGNRAFAHAYRPERFNAMLRAGLRRTAGKPRFLALHLCAAHWPFHFADAADGQGYTPTTRVLDRQLGDILDLLPEAGINPEQSLVILFADHGDTGDAASRKPRPKRTITLHNIDYDPGMPISGHGASLLDPVQWRIFALFSGRSAHGEIGRGNSGQLAALDSIEPTLMALLGIGEPGVAVLDVALGVPGTRRLDRQAVPMETGLRSGGLDLTNPDPAVAAAMARALYRIRPDGTTELTQRAYAVALHEKDIGVTDDRGALIRLWRPEGDVLVSANFESGEQHIYPPTRPATAPAPKLLADACRVKEFRERLPSWCGSASDWEYP